MSVQAARDFIDKAEKDPGVRDEVRKNVQDVVGIAKKYGHHFSHEHFVEAMKEKWSKGVHPDFTLGPDKPNYGG